MRRRPGDHPYGRHRVRLVLMLGLLVAMAGLAGCGGAPESIGFAVSCAGVGAGVGSGPASGIAAAGARTVPGKVLHTTTSTLVLVPVCLSGHGPYPFILDTGAARSLVDQKLANRLHLFSTGATLPATGVGCTATAGQVWVRGWSLGDVPLQSQPLMSLSMAGPSGGMGIAGLLGSDVWSRFGRFQLNYRSGQVTLPGPEHATAPTAAPTPSGNGVPMTVIHPRSGALALVPVTINGHPPLRFAVDTGSTHSVLDRAVAHRWGLPATGHAQQVSGVSCAATAQPVHVDSWQAGTIALPEQNLDSITLPIPELAGLIGSDVLYHYGTITIDYSASRLILTE